MCGCRGDHKLETCGCTASSGGHGAIAIGMGGPCRGGGRVRPASWRVVGALVPVCLFPSFLLPVLLPFYPPNFASHGESCEQPECNPCMLEHQQSDSKLGWHLPTAERRSWILSQGRWMLKAAALQTSPWVLHALPRGRGAANTNRIILSILFQAYLALIERAKKPRRALQQIKYNPAVQLHTHVAPGRFNACGCFSVLKQLFLSATALKHALLSCFAAACVSLCWQQPPMQLPSFSEGLRSL